MLIRLPRCAVLKKQTELFMKKILLAIAVVLPAIFTSCDLINKKSDNAGDAGKSEQTEAADSIATPGEEVPEPEIPVPDNTKAERIIAKFNQGPAINNIDYADALEYAEIYLTLTADNVAALTSDDKSKHDAAESAIKDVEKEYPYNAELIQILYQAAALDKTEGGLVPMNDDNRARFEALVLSYDRIGKN